MSRLAPDGPGLPDLLRLHCTSFSSAMQLDVCFALLTAKPRRTEGGQVCVIMNSPQPRYQDSGLFRRLRFPTFLPSKLFARGQKHRGRSQNYNVSPRFPILSYMSFYLTCAFILVDSRYWKCHVWLNSQQLDGLFDSYYNFSVWRSAAINGTFLPFLFSLWKRSCS